MKVPIMETKQVLLKSYYHFSILEKAIKMICKNSMEKIKVSVLGNFVEKYATSTNDVVNKRNYIATFFESLFDENYELDSFYNPDIGRVFVTGFLVPMFLQQVGDKKLGALSGGPYGILRGLGISEATANAYVKKLINGEYLLVARGDCIEIERLKTTLDGLQNYVGRKNDKP